MMQTLGLDAPDRNNLIRGGSAGLAIVLFIGFSAVPISMLTNSIKAPSGEAPADTMEANAKLSQAAIEKDARR